MACCLPLSAILLPASPCRHVFGMLFWCCSAERACVYTAVFKRLFDPAVLNATCNPGTRMQASALPEPLSELKGLVLDISKAGACAELFDSVHLYDATSLAGKADGSEYTVRCQVAKRTVWCVCVCCQFLFVVCSVPHPDKVGLRMLGAPAGIQHAFKCGPLLHMTHHKSFCSCMCQVHSRSRPSRDVLSRLSASLIVMKTGWLLQ